MPDGATVTLDGRRQGPERRFVFNSLKAGETSVVDAAISFADGGKASRTLLLRGGERLMCIVTMAGHRLPELVLQMGHSRLVRSVAFSHDGRQVLTGSLDRTAIVWDAASGQKLRTFRGHTGWVNSAVFSADSRQVLTGSRDQRAKAGI